MFTRQNILSFIAGTIPPSTLYGIRNRVIVHPFFHTVSDEYLSHIHPLYKPKSIKAFEKDIDFLSRHFEAININTVFLTKNREQTKNAFHLSFDDGLRGVYETVLPLLFQKGIPATIFVNSDFIDNRRLFYRHKAALLIDKLHNQRVSKVVQKKIATILDTNFTSKHSLQTNIRRLPYSWENRLDAVAPLLEIDFQTYLKKNKPYLTTSELKEMQKKGFTIGAHSIDHPRFSELDESEQIRQTLESCNYVKKTFQESQAYFSFPFSEDGVQNSFFKAIENKIGLCFGIAGISTQHGFLIGRIDMEKNDRNAREIINKAFLKYRIKSNFSCI